MIEKADSDASPVVFSRDPDRNRPYRDGTADLLKGLAVLLMIQVHIMEQFVTTDTHGSVIGKVSMFLGGPACAPVFLAVMGYFLAFSEKPLAYFLKRGGLLFLAGILLNIGRSGHLLIEIIRGETTLDPWFFIMGADILTLAGLSLIFTGLLRLILKHNGWLYLSAALLVAGITPLLNKIASSGTVGVYITAFFWGTSEWSYFPVFPWLGYVLAGYAFHLLLFQIPFLNRFDVQKQLLYIIPLWIAIMITIPYASVITHNLSGPGGYYHHGILFFIWTLLFMISYLVLVKLTEIIYGEQGVVMFIKWIGRKVTSLYVIQWLIIGNLATWLYCTQDLFQFAAWFILVTTATLVTGWLVEKALKKLSEKKHAV
jgi:uncharacterized membrane protein